LAQIHVRLACGEETWEWFDRLRTTLAEGIWDVQVEEDGRPAPGLYLALLCYHLSRVEMEAFASHLKIFRNDLTLLRQVADLKDAEDKLNQTSLSNRQLYALLRHSTSASRMILWLCSSWERVRGRLVLYETNLRNVQPLVDGAYLKSLGLQPSPLFSRLLNAIRDARLDGEIHTIEEEKALIAHLLEERDKL